MVKTRKQRLSLGVVARLSRYLQILTQGQKAGLTVMPSKTLSEHAHVNPTQIRRDLSMFGKFGKRGVGYNIDFLIGELKRILGTSSEHRIAMMGAGKLGSAIAGSSIFSDHGFQLSAIFDTDKRKVGKKIGHTEVRHLSELPAVVKSHHIVVGVLAVPPDVAQEAAQALVDAGIKIIFNYTESLLNLPPGVTVHSMNPVGELLYALYFYLS